MSRQQPTIIERLRAMLAVLLLLLPLTLYAQDKVTLHLHEVPAKTVFDAITHQTGLTFLYDSSLATSWPKVSVSADSETTNEVLDGLMTKLGCRYDIDGRMVTITRLLERTHRFVSGTVTDEHGEPLPGVVIQVQGSNLKTVTDGDGSYKISAPYSPCILVYSYIGMKDHSLSLAEGKADLHRAVSLKGDNMLSEVVVTGYQTISRERATGSYNIIKGDELKDRHASSLAKALDGLATGLQSTDDGRGGKKFTIRGTSTMLADQTPLVVVDGFPIMDNLSSTASTNPNLNALERLNPDDIESITVLKDAAAASIWGARSANGVIVITTKKAMKGQPLKVSASSQFSVGHRQNVDQVTGLASSAKMIAYEKWCFERGMLGTQYTGEMGSLYNAITPSQLLLYQGMSWGTISKDEMNTQLATLAARQNNHQISKEMLRTPVTSLTNASLSYGTGLWTTRASLDYEYDAGDFIGHNDNTWKVNWDNEFQAAHWLKFNLGVNMVNTNHHNSAITFTDLASLAPYEMLLNEDGSYASDYHASYNTDVLSKYDWSQFPYTNMNYNLLQEARNRRVRMNNLQWRLQAGMQLTILEGLTFNSKFQYEQSRYNQRQTNDEESFYTRYRINYFTPGDGEGNATGKPLLPKGAIVIGSHGRNHSTLFRNDFNLDRTFGGKHAVSAVIGSEISNYYYDTYTDPYLYGVTSSSRGIIGPEGYYDTMDGSSSTVTGVPIHGLAHLAESWIHNRYVSFYGNASYMYDERYGVSASARSDASNLITSEARYRWSPLWSVGLMWNIANEHWMKGRTPLNRLTLRATYGKNGNAPSSSSARTTLNTAVTDLDEWTGEHPATIVDYGNPTLRWEKTATTNLGLDFSLWDSALYGSIDYYNKKSTDVLGSVAIAGVNGTTKATFNNAEINNHGLEVSLGTQLSFGDFCVNALLTYSYNKNKVQRLYNELSTVSDMLNSTYVTGYPMSPIFTFNYGGMKDGIPTILDADGTQIPITDPSIWTMDYTRLMHYQGSMIQPHTLGLNLTLNWKKLSLSAYVNGRFGGKMYMPSFSYYVIDNYGGKILPTVALNDLIAADGTPLTDTGYLLPLPTTDSEGNDIDVNTYGYWSFSDTSIDRNVKSASYIYLSEIDLNYELPETWFKTGIVKGIQVYGKLEDVGLLWSANPKHYHPDYLPGTYRPATTFTLGANIDF